MTKPCIDNPEIKKALEGICQTITDNGGYIDPNIAFSYKNDDFSVYKTDEITAPHALKIPHDLLVPFRAFDLDVEDGRIVIDAHQDHVTPLQLNMFEKILALYNATLLFSNHYRDNPWLNYERHHQIVALLLRGRVGHDMSLIRKMLTDPDYKDELALFTFFKKRVAHSRLHSSSTQRTEVIMPLIEFLTHHPQGARYKNIHDDDGGASYMTITAHSPVEGSNLCYASFGSIDALEGYLHYGFVAENVPFARSVPLQIEVEGLGKIIVSANNAPVPMNKRPPHLQNLGYYLPSMKFFDEDNALRLSHLVMPGPAAPQSLKRVLREAVLAFDAKMDDAAIASYVKDIEVQLIEQNLDFYSELSSLVDFSPASSVLIRDLKRVIEHQRQIIALYQKSFI
jgi:hypothetical protein